MGSQVTVTLTALNGDLSIAQRNIVLNKEKPSVPIGRSSKTAHKGLLGAANNAWFDSPVMSRNHASLGLDLENKKVIVKDIGSMHGTFLNDQPLPKDIPTVINDDDVLTFGAEVTRGHEVFPACRFLVTCRSLRYKAPNTFTLPDPSDVEDEGEEACDGFSEDDIKFQERNRRYSTEDGVSIESSPPKSSGVHEAIDLTGDDFPQSSLSNSIDLTGETEPEKKTMYVMAGRPADEDRNTHSVSTGMHAGSLPAVDDSDEERFDFSQADDSDADESIGSAYVRGIEDLFNDESDESDDSANESSSEDSDVESNAGPAQDSVMNVASPEVTPTNNIIQSAVATDNKNDITRLSVIRTRVDDKPVQDSDNEDDGSIELGLGEAGDEEMRDLHYKGPPPACLGNFTRNVGYDSEMESESETHFLHKAIPAIPAPKPATFYLGSTIQPSQVGITNFHVQPGPIARQPSPSDAAMAKSAAPTGYFSACYLGSSFLGAKSGKSAFFAAREVNKTRANSGDFTVATDSALSVPATNGHINVFFGESRLPKAEGQHGTVTGSAVSSLSESAEPTPTRSKAAPANTFESESLAANRPEAISSKFIDRQFSATSLNQPATIIQTRDYSPFLGKPDQPSMPERAPSPLPDMTSPHVYNTSRATYLSASEPKCCPRSAIKIPDIIDTSSPSLRTHSLKRKSDLMSDLTNLELRNWAESDDVDVDPMNSALLSQAVIEGKGSENAPATSDAPKSRPTKRLKKLLGNVGYIALGGATIFAALVATAPDLL